MNDMTTALWITALGMGLVFAAILVLWLMMSILTAVLADKKSASDSATEPDSPTLSLTPRFDSAGAPLSANKKREDIAQAAAIAVAIALADQETSTAHVFPEPPTAIVSAWQLGMRTRLLAEKGYTRRHTR